MAHRDDLLTPASDVLRFFRVLADDTRLAIVRMLALSDLRAGEIGGALQMPSNAVAYHLKQLQRLALLQDRRSSADARDIYYHLDLPRLQSLFAATGDALYPGMGGESELVATGSEIASDAQARPPDAMGAASLRLRPLPPLRVLFLCTHNSARSQLAEGILRSAGGDQVEAFSAGSDPTAVDPDALIVLRELGVDPAPLHAKTLALFTGQSFDYLITVCDRVRDVCPVFPGDPNQVHWSFADPAVIADPDRRLQAFRQVARDLQIRMRYLLLLPHPTTGQRLRLLRSLA
jgi:protein-tyrosine-phosphatase/DNA-binding transcriptional ArsR family regulator